jgi:hypothetical protein
VENLREEVTGACGAVGDEGEDLGEEALLGLGVLGGVSGGFYAI